MSNSSDDKNVGATQIDNGFSNPKATPSFGQRAKRHCARFWWLHLLIFCIIFLIIALCLVYVAMPKIAQDGVNDSSLTFTDLAFLNPTPNTVTLTQKGILNSPSRYTPTLDAFNASLWLVTNGTFAATPFMTIPMPKIHALHPRSNVSVNGEVVTVTDLDQLTDYCIQVMTNPNVTTALTGKTKLHEGKLPVTTIHYNSSSTYAALNGLAGFNVTNARINLTSTPNFFGDTYIPNPSVMTIAMGNVTLSLSTAAAGVVGNATINDMTLVPGNNTLPMTAVINATKVLDSMDTEGNVEMMITGTDAVYGGQELSYYRDALKSNVLTLTMNVTQILADST